MSPSHVLVPLDGSPLATEALTHALDTFECHVTVLNIVTPVDATMSEGGILEPGDDREETAEQRAERILDRAKTQAADADREIDTAVESGDPAETIVAYAEGHDIDHIVMGGHGGEKGALTRLLGTVATTVVSEAPMSVTVIR